MNSDTGNKPTVCERCGAFGEMDHEWTEGDCVLPHRNHSTRLIVGTHVCIHCVDRWKDWLKEIVELYATLDEVTLAGSIPDDTAEHQHTKKAPASPSPLRLDAWALLYGKLNAWVKQPDGTMEHQGMTGLPDIPDVLHNWVEAIYDALGWTGSTSTAVSASTALLTVQAETIAGLEDVDTFDAELRWIRRSLNNAHGIPAPTVIGKCLNVDCEGTVRPRPNQPAKCNRCGRTYGGLDIVRLRGNEQQAS